jgi:hypothetical protein
MGSTNGGYLTLTTRPIKAGERVVVDYGNGYFPKCVCDTCSGGPRKVGKGTDNREESMEGQRKRKREKSNERKKRRKLNKAIRSGKVASNT